MQVRLPHVWLGKAQRIAQIEIVLPPATNRAIIQRLEGGRRPRGGVPPIGDRVNAIAGEQGLGDGPVVFRHAIDVGA